MKWTRIEQKWHEMAQRLQNPAADTAKAALVGVDRARDNPGATPPPDAAAVRNPDARAMA